MLSHNTFIIHFRIIHNKTIPIKTETPPIILILLSGYIVIICKIFLSLLGEENSNSPSNIKINPIADKKSIITKYGANYPQHYQKIQKNHFLVIEPWSYLLR